VGRGWAAGTVELRNRFSGQVRELAVGAALATEIMGAVAGNRT
jgi:prolyl-tRNA synthetase